jgi:hypothetical protein
VDPIIGIDLGTTNSARLPRAGRPDVIPNALGGRLTPSAVGVDETVGVGVDDATTPRHPGRRGDADADGRPAGDRPVRE